MSEEFSQKIEKLVKTHLEPITQEVDFKDPRFFKTNFRKLNLKIFNKFDSIPKKELEVFFDELMMQLVRIDFSEFFQKIESVNELNREELLKDD